MAIPEVLRGLGAEPAGVLAEAGFDLGLFDDPDNLITYSARGHLLAHCVARTGCQHVGLLVGQRCSLDSLGLVGVLVKHSPDVGTALRSLERHFSLHVRGAVQTLTVEGKSAVLAYLASGRRVEAADQTAVGAVAANFNIMRSLCGPGWQPTEVRFARRRPADVGPFRRFFRAPLRFDADQYALEFPASWLNRRLPGEDAELRRLLQKQISRLEARHQDDFPEQVRNVLRTSLLTRHARADQVAAFFSMHSRTLSRRLGAFGTGFQELVDEGRFEIARQLLEDTSLEVSAVAASLGYTSASAFTRAFQRWSGTTPTSWRAKRDAWMQVAPSQPAGASRV
jgi:AraC-like DNA-binding protein